jgi:hypothetical protein
MASDESSGARPAPVVLRIKLRYDDVEAMVQRFAPNVGKSGLFLPTKSLQAVGAEVKFELRLADDKPVLVGLGRVKAAKAPDPANPKAAFGMAIELMRVTRESREVILKMLERRKVLGLPEIGIPHPADIDAARRGEVVDPSVKDTTNTAVPLPTVAIESAPVLATQMNPDSGPVMTAPRRNTGPLAVAKAHNVAPLEPEAPRKKRAAVAEVIERASGPISVGAAVRVPGLDDDVDVVAVLARARTLAGGNLDDELEALREMSAAPIEIGIEAASAELAKQLGGAAVRRDRSAKWAPPPSTISAPVEAPIEAKVEAPVVESPAVEAPVAQAPLEVRAEPIIEAPAPAATFVEPPSDMESEPAESETPSPDVVELRDSTPILDVEPDPEDEDHEDAAHEVDADQIADEIHQLGDGDVEEVEHTQIGEPVDPSIDPEAFHQHVFATEPAVTADLERSLDRHLADAEAEADDLDLARAQPPEEQPEEEVEEEIDDFEILAEADAEDADLLSAHGEQEASGAHVIGSAPSQLEADPEPAHEPELEPEREAPEQLADEHPHIPARIRAQQRRVSGQHQIVRSASPVLREPEPEPYEPEPYEPEQRPSFADFAARLELSDEFEAVPEADVAEPPSAGRHAILSELDNALGELEPRSLGEIDPRSLSAGHALAAFEDPDGEPAEEYESESAFTIAGDMPVDSIDFDAPHVEQPSAFPPLHSFDSSDVSVPMVRVNPPGRASKVAGAAESYDLETALEALDVDLDDLSIPQEPPPSPPPRPPARPARGERVPKRVETDIPIDFDDFEDE